MENKALLQEALKTIEARRLQAENKAFLNRGKCMENNEFAALEYKIRACAFDIAVKNSKCENTADDLIRYNNMLAERERLTVGLGYSTADLSPQYYCKKCNDTGYNANGLCDCVKQLYNEKLKNLNRYSKISDFTFENFDERVFKEEKSKTDMQKLYRACYDFCKKFPDTNKRNLIFLGKTGVGKTCLISAIANELTKRNFMVCYLSAFELNQRFLSYHTSDMLNKSKHLEGILNCDVLIIDDLGTEPILKNVTIEYLFTTINQRSLENKHTVISTNLTLENILDRYGERIFSRLADKNKSKIMRLSSVDLRISKPD